MLWRGETWAVSADRYNCATDEKEWSLRFGFGGAVPVPQWTPSRYRYMMMLSWYPLASCFEWWAEYLGVEKHRGVVVQYRVHKFKRWPISLRFMRTVDAPTKPLPLPELRPPDHHVPGP